MSDDMFHWEELEVLEDENVWRLSRISAGYYPNGAEGEDGMRIEIQLVAGDQIDDDGMVSFRPTLEEVEAWCQRARELREERGIK